MLAMNFKTAKELGLKEEGHLALIRVLHDLEGGKLKHSQTPSKNGFNMRPVWDVGECGTLGCIAGWAQFYMGKPWVKNIGFCGDPLAINNQSSQEMHDLFGPGRFSRKELTVEQAAHALRTYLVTGTPDWS